MLTKLRNSQIRQNSQKCIWGVRVYDKYRWIYPLPLVYIYISNYMLKCYKCRGIEHV